MIHYIFTSRGDESDYSEDAPYGETRSDEGESTGSVSTSRIVEKNKSDDIVPAMTKYIPDERGEVFGTANDQVRCHT